jgi:hypothetical protein
VKRAINRIAKGWAAGSLAGVLFCCCMGAVSTPVGGGLAAADIDTAAELATIQSDETGSAGGYVRATSPTLTTPVINGATNTAAIASTGYSLTGSNATSAIDLAGTWNTSGTPTLIKANVTDTASNANSLLMDLQVGGVSKLSVSKSSVVRSAGDMTIMAGSGFVGTISVGAGGSNYFSIVGSTGAATFSSSLTVNGLSHGSVTAGITASTTQTQGQGALTKNINEVSTCANANDTVTLPTAAPGLRITVINNGAQTLRIFPASGDDLGAGVNTATTLAAGGVVSYVTYNTTNWEID